MCSISPVTMPLIFSFYRIMLARISKHKIDMVKLGPPVLCTTCLWRLGVASCLVNDMSVASGGRFLSCVGHVCGVSGSFPVLCTTCLWRLGVVSCLVYEKSVASRGRFLNMPTAVVFSSALQSNQRCSSLHRIQCQATITVETETPRCRVCLHLFVYICRTQHLHCVSRPNVNVSSLVYLCCSPTIAASDSVKSHIPAIGVGQR